MRLCAAVDGFHARYGRWPTEVRTSSPAADILYGLAPSEWEIVHAKLRLVADDSVGMVAADGGDEYDYGVEGFPNGRPWTVAEDWLLAPR